MKLPRVRITVQRVTMLMALTALCMSGVLHVSEGLPDGWDAKEFETAVKRVVDPQSQANVTIEILAWSTQEDDRPLLVDSALA